MSASASDVSVTGFGLFRSTSSAWTWEAVSTSPPVVSAQSIKDGYRMTFSAPVSAFAGLDAEKMRVGVVTGGVGAKPRVWFTPNKSFAADANAPSPWAANIFAQAALREASVSIGDGMLRVELAFDAAPSLRTGWDLYLFIYVDGDDSNGFQGADYMFQNTGLAGEATSALAIPWFEIRPGLLKPGEQTTVTAWVQNTTASPLPGTTVSLMLPNGLALAGGPGSSSLDLRPKEAKRLIWQVSALKSGVFLIRMQADVQDLRYRAAQWVTVTTKRDPKREFRTLEGAWLAFPERPTLQAGNKARVEQLKSLPSKNLKRNLFGITAHLPRSTDEEDPFTASHVIDGDLSTCWASRWWRTSIPFSPEWVQVDLGRVASVAEVRFLPAWRSTGAPAALAVTVSEDGTGWRTVADDPDYHLQHSTAAGPSWQTFKFSEQPVRYVRLESSRLNQGGTGFFCSPGEPFQFRIGEIALFDKSGNRIPARRAAASTTHHAWYNSPDTINKAWPLLLKSGVKLNRIGQWGDKIDWATVEKIKGVYKIDPEVDRAIAESVSHGVEILMTLNYGNNLYQKVKDPPDFGPTWHRGHPFLQCAPTTPEAVQGFANYCAFMAKHFRGRVKCFEIWNEENGWFFDAWSDNGKVEMVRAYGRALTAAAKAIKQASPNAIVVFGGTAGSTLDFPRIALEEGAGPFIDIFAFHPYGHPTPESAPSHFLTEVGGLMDWKPRPERITDYETEIAEFKQLLHRYNPKMEVWADEMNWFAPGEPPSSQNGDQSEMAQAKYLSRFYAENAWVGCGAIWWSLYNSNGVQEWAIVRSADLTPRPAYYSAGYVSTILDDVKAAPDVVAKVLGDSPPDLVVNTYRSGHGEIIIGLWRKSTPDDTCKPTPVTLCLPNQSARSAALADALYGYRQKACMVPGSDGIVLPDLLIGDWPVFVVLKNP